MKNSEITWIGEIPENWDIVPIYKLFSERKNKNSNGIEKNLLSLSYGKIKRRNIYAKGGLLPESFNTYNIVEPGDIIIRPTDLQNDQHSLRTGLVKEHGIITSAYICLAPISNTNSNYYQYLLHSYDIVKVFYNMGNGVRQGLNYREFSHLKVLLPSQKEQKRIANFLDKKCGQIDKLLTQINDEIEQLKFYRNRLIIRTVIRGLNPNVPMKDSGIEWVGSIPESWGVVPLYKLFNERKNKNIAGREQNLLSLSYGKIKRRDINAKGGLLPANFNTYNIVEDGDIIIRPTDLQNDQHSLRTGLVKEHGIITSAYIDLAPLPNTNSAYYHYLLHSYDIEKVFYNMGNGVRQGLNYSEFSKLKVLVPSGREMSNIVNYLDQKNSKLDSLVEKKQQQLNLLKEYKNSLIYEYVTGKKQVPKM